jgi:hypothetical protein
MQVRQPLVLHLHLVDGQYACTVAHRLHARHASGTS